MAVRQSTTPLSYSRSNRVDRRVLQSSMRAGKVALIDFVPVLRGDSVGGELEVEFTLSDMPKPLLNGVMVNVQSWFVPKSHHPQFSGWDEFVHSYNLAPIRQLGAADRAAPAFYNQVATGAPETAARASDHYKTLGLYSGGRMNDDLFDAYTLIHNFRLAAHSSKMTRRQYYRENAATSLLFARAFWPQNRFSRVVPDYETALVTGAVPLDVSAGALSVSNMIRSGVGSNVTAANTGITGLTPASDPANLNKWLIGETANGNNGLVFEVEKLGGNVRLNLAGNSILTTSLQDLDKARLAIAMAKRRQAMAGNNATGFASDDVIMAELMAGFSVHQDMLSRPMLLGSQMVPFGFVERFATEADKLDASLTRGATRVRVPINLPVQEAGGLILTIAEIVPERIYERQSDESQSIASPTQLPDADRDVLRTLPVDVVFNRRIDTMHATPVGTFGFEGMNDKWNREFTALGGVFRQPTPGTPVWTEARSALWVPEMLNPTYSADHFLVPEDFPHNVFSDTTGPAAEFVVRRSATINGLTQIGDVLKENNADYAAMPL